MDNKAIIIFKIPDRNEEHDMEIPLDITANDLVMALNQAYNLEIDITDMKNCCLKSERPIALLKGNKLLSEFGIRNGSEIFYTK